MQQLQIQNQKLKQFKTNCQDELHKLKQNAQSHQNQIDTLLKFNERLLGIIQNQFSAAAKSKFSNQLQIISERNQKESQGLPQNKFQNNLAGKGFHQNELENLQNQDQDQEQEVQFTRNPQNNQPTPKNNPTKNGGNKLIEVPKLNKHQKLAQVFEAQNKIIEQSINLEESLKRNSQNDVITQVIAKMSHKKKEVKQDDQFSEQVSEVLDMIKQYKEEFIDNSSEYQHICQILHNDLVNDMNEVKKMQQDSSHFYKTKFIKIDELRNEVKKFQPVNELIKVMKKLKVPNSTQTLLRRKIIQKSIS